MIYVDPGLRQDILWQRHSRDYYINEHLPQPSQYDEPRNFHLHASHLRKLVRYVPRRGCLLDLDCAGGLFLVAARLDGWEGRGNELNTFAARHARESLGTAVETANFEDLRL